MKRGRNFIDYVANYTRSKKRRLCPPMDFTRRQKYWVSASRLRNYMIRDPLVDWLELYARDSSVHNRVSEGGFIEFIKNRGIEFESRLVKYLHDTKIPIVSVSEYITDASVKRTIDLMKAGTPVIHSAPLKHRSLRTKGIADLLVRSDYLDKIVEEDPLKEEERKIAAPNLNGNYHYVVIDIKFSTLPLRADGRHLLNSGSYPAYKAQTWIYNQAVGAIQGYTPRYSYILGRRWSYTSRKIPYHGLQCLDRLGVIDFEGVDKEYIDRTKKALKWYRDVRQFGNNWEVSPPSRPELYPNMCVDSGKWNKQKEKIANDNGEITTVWYCGVRERQNALDRDIETWRDERCTSETLGVRGVRAPVIDAILDVNRQSDDKIRPARVRSDMFGWRMSQNEMFVDFETLIDVFSDFDQLPKQERTNQIFMIGVYYHGRAGWQYRSFVCDELTHDEEFRVMNEFAMFVRGHGNPKMWFWHAEKTMWTQAENRQFDFSVDDEKRKDVICHDWATLDDWCDLAKLFRAEPVVVKDCFKFGLKVLVKAMVKQGLINTKMESECDSGTTAAVKAWNAYRIRSNPAQSATIKDIEKYNEFDVKALFDILTYLRKNHA